MTVAELGARMGQKEYLQWTRYYSVKGARERLQAKVSRRGR